MFIFLDTETTGAEAEDRLCQLAYKTDDGREKCNKLFNPEKEISIEAMSIHHITNEMVARRPLFKNSNELKKVKALLENPSNNLVAHNAKFDVEILQKEGVFPHNVICTLKLARFLDKEGYFKKYNLQYLRYAMNILVNAKAHDAWGDILVLEKVFQRIFQKILDENDGNQELTIKTMLEISSKPSMLTRITFGKHKGELFKNLPKDYLSWLMSKDDLDEDLKNTVNYYLGS